MKRAVIFGATGQDGSYLSELLLSKNYEVIGVSRRSSSDNTARLRLSLKHPRFKLVQGDVTDITSIYRILHEYQPHEVYNLAAQSHVWTSFKQPQLTWNVTAQGCLNVLETILTLPDTPKFYQASSSEMFGDSCDIDVDEEIDIDGRYQDENTVFNPQSPYAIAKLAAHNATALYRKAYGVFACSGILFNHESERRGKEFLTRKVSSYIADLYQSKKNGTFLPKLKLGNLLSHRDWGHAIDYVEAMWLMLQHDKPGDYVISTGKTYTVEEFIIEAFKCINIYGYEDYVEIDKKLYRPSEVPYLRGDSSKAKSVLGWEPTISFRDLVQRMVDHDIQSRSTHGRSAETAGKAGGKDL